MVTTVAVMMVGPGLAGHWLDGRLGTRFCALVGFGLGIAIGLYYLLASVARLQRRPGAPRSEHADRESRSRDADSSTNET
ncbi:MAG: AtpZ/AtpI family protein [Planctomycetes bacterium]|nr:AtpZ/AtpI family protein [Planctomycetota bacterium]